MFVVVQSHLAPAPDGKYLRPKVDGVAQPAWCWEWVEAVLGGSAAITPCRRCRDVRGKSDEEKEQNQQHRGGGMNRGIISASCVTSQKDHPFQSRKMRMNNIIVLPRVGIQALMAKGARNDQLVLVLEPPACTNIARRKTPLSPWRSARHGATSPPPSL